MEDDFESVGEFWEVDLADLRCWWCKGEDRYVDMGGAIPVEVHQKMISVIPEICQD